MSVWFTVILNEVKNLIVLCLPTLPMAGGIKRGWFLTTLTYVVNRIQMLPQASV